jgi:hypothetical protein
MMTSYNHFPHLEVLSLSGFSASSQFEMLSGCIPSNLKELKIHGNQVSYGTLSLSSLPKSLTKMDCNLDELKITPESDCRFPESLKTLILNKLFFEALHLLPPDIEHLKITRLGRGVESLSIEDWKAISRLTKLESLYLGYYGRFGVKSAEMLPRSLKSLIFSGSIGIKNEALCIDILRALPPSLTQLNGIWPKREVTQMIAQNLPRNLRELGLDYWTHVVPLGVASLPDSITRLDIYATVEEYEHLTSLPASLTALKVNQLPERLFGLLPAHLQSLHVDGLQGLLKISSEMIEKLPRGLKTWEVPYGEMRDEESDCRALPPSLTKLLWSPSSSWGAPHNAQHLPRTLKHLNMNLPRSQLDEPHCDWATWILGLPSSLTKLEFSPQYLLPSAFEAFGTLPNLEVLEVVVWREQKEGWAKEFLFSTLPRQLTYLKLVDMGTHFNSTQDCGITYRNLKGSPPSLTVLSIPRCKVTGGDLASFSNLWSCTFTNGMYIS